MSGCYDTFLSKEYSLMASPLTERIKAGLAESVTTVQSLESHISAIESAVTMIRESLENGGKVMTAGNGGSAAEALHMSEELVGRFKSDRPSLAGICLCADPTALTCIGNDYGFDSIFSRQVQGLGKPGDVLVLFSTSGKAANLKNAAEEARAKQCRLISLLGRDGGQMAGLSDIEIVVSGSATERIQEAHQVILHLILDELEDLRA